MFHRITNCLKGLDNDSKETLKNGVYAFAVRILGAMSALGVNVYLARLLGPDSFGVFSLALVIVTILGVLTRLGLGTVLLREIGAEQKAAVNGYGRYITDKVLQLVLFVSLTLILIIIISSHWISATIFQKTTLGPILREMSPLLLYCSLGFIIGEALKGIRCTSSGIFFQNTMLPLLFILVHYSSFIIYGTNTSQSVQLYSGVSIFTTIFSYFYWRCVTVSNIKTKDISIFSLLNMGMPLLMMSSCSLLIAWTDIIILGIFETERIVGIYVAASKIAFASSLILVAINASVAPKFSFLYRQRDFEKLKKLANQVTRLMILLAVLPTVLLLVLPSWVLGWFGSGFNEGVMALFFLTIGQFVNVACGSVGYMLVMTGNEIIFRNIMVGTALVNLMANLILVNLFGMVGVAAATAICVATWNVLAVLAVKQKLGFWMFK